MKITIVDYGMGNIQSIISTLKYLKAGNVTVSAKYEDLKSADKLILPGVGSFAKAINEIRAKDLESVLQELVIQNGKPILGICLGMQLLGVSSTENGFNKGLGFINGQVTKFSNNDIKVPHVGFNQVKINKTFKLYKGFSTDSVDFYFTHSFKMLSDDDIGQSHCFYGSDFIASFESNNIAGVQFHPELSQTNGLKLLKNFIESF